MSNYKEEQHVPEKCCLVQLKQCFNMPHGYLFYFDVAHWKTGLQVFNANISGLDMQHRVVVIIKIITKDPSLEARILSETKGLPQLESALLEVLTR